MRSIVITIKGTAHWGTCSNENVFKVAAKHNGPVFEFMGSTKGPEFDEAFDAANSLINSNQENTEDLVVRVAAMVIDVYDVFELENIVDLAPFGLTRLRDIHRLCSQKVTIRVKQE